MIERDEAFRIAGGACEPNLSLAGAIESRKAWYFPQGVSASGGEFIGFAGALVDKKSRQVREIGSYTARNLHGYLSDYDSGTQTDYCDLVVLAVSDVALTCTALGHVGLHVDEFSYEHGFVWRDSRRQTDVEIAAQLKQLPVVFPDVSGITGHTALADARRDGYFDYVAVPRQKPRGMVRVSVGEGGLPADCEIYRDRYSELPGEDLIEIALNPGLRPEARDPLRDELRARGITQGTLDAALRRRQARDEEAAAMQRRGTGLQIRAVLVVTVGLAGYAFYRYVLWALGLD